MNTVTKTEDYDENLPRKLYGNPRNRPDKCEPKRDFGRGFYGTKLREQAGIFAVRKGNRKHTESVITEFEFDEDVYEDQGNRTKIIYS
jgi:hypothetical protein